MDVLLRLLLALPVNLEAVRAAGELALPHLSFAASGVGLQGWGMGCA